MPATSISKPKTAKNLNSPGSLHSSTSFPMGPRCHNPVWEGCDEEGFDGNLIKLLIKITFPACTVLCCLLRRVCITHLIRRSMTDSCWFLQVIRGEYVLDTLFDLERVWNGRPAQRQVRDIAFVGLGWRSLERNSRTCSGSLDRGLDRDVGFLLFRTNHCEW